MSLPPRFITVLCLVQAFFIIAGYLVTGSSLKLFDQVMPDMLGSHASRIPAISQFVRSFGLWCLLVPIVWYLVAGSHAEVTRDGSFITLPQLLAGSVLTVALAGAFSLAALYAMRICFGPM